MRNNLLWILLLIWPLAVVRSRPADDLRDLSSSEHNAYSQPTHHGSSSSEQVISVRITSSVAVGRTQIKPRYHDRKYRLTSAERVQTQLAPDSVNIERVQTQLAPDSVNIERVQTQLAPDSVNIERVQTQLAPDSVNIERVQTQLAPDSVNIERVQTQLAPDSVNIERVQTQLAPDSVNIENKSAILNNDTENTVSDVMRQNETQLLSKGTPLYRLISENPPTTQTPVMDFITEPDTATTLEDISEISGPNIDFLKQLDARKSRRGDVPFFHGSDEHLTDDDFNVTDTEDSIAEPSIKEILELSDDSEKEDNIEDIPLARSVPFSSSKNRIIDTPLVHKTISDTRSNSKLTTVSFNVVHDTSSVPNIAFNSNSQSLPQLPKGLNLSELPKLYNEPAQVYSQPAKVYSEPSKFYSEPAKVYSEPSKVYGEPAKVYSEPAKVYSEPAKFYSQPASLHLPPGVSNAPWQGPSQGSTYSTSISTSPAPAVSTTPAKELHRNVHHQVEKNYEVDEKVSVLTDGRSHGVQIDEEKDSSKEKCKQENCKVGYVVEGRQYKKYQVEEKTPDGFIVGEYGVVRHEDGALRGVRYTADGAVSPRLIYDTLMKFLQLK